MQSTFHIGARMQQTTMAVLVANLCSEDCTITHNFLPSYQVLEARRDMRDMELYMLLDDG